VKPRARACRQLAQCAALADTGLPREHHQLPLTRRNAFERASEGVHQRAASDEWIGSYQLRRRGLVRLDEGLGRGSSR